MKYIMITQFRGHWNQLPEDVARFPLGMLKGDMKVKKVKDDTKTIFIKLNTDTGKPEHAWEGKITVIKITSNNISFRVSLEKEIAPPLKYVGYGIGCI